MKIGVFGKGRLGTAVASLAAKEEGIEVAWIIDKGEKPAGKVEAVLDASAAQAVGEHIEWALEMGTNIVIGATGWDDSALATLRRPDLRIGALVSPNFSLSVAFMRRAALALGRFAAIEGGSSLAILERHHAAKADAPSGTAKLLAGALAEGCPRYTGWNMGRSEEGRINVASLRVGAEVGYHEMRLETGDDTIVISHEAYNRTIFAKGALVALRWICGKRGLYTFDDLAAELIDPLFA